MYESHKLGPSSIQTGTRSSSLDDVLLAVDKPADTTRGMVRNEGTDSVT